MKLLSARRSTVRDTALPRWDLASTLAHASQTVTIIEQPHATLYNHSVLPRHCVAHIPQTAKESMNYFSKQRTSYPYIKVRNKLQTVA